MKSGCRLRRWRFFGICLSFLLVGCTSRAPEVPRREDWPTYRHDNARSGITPEKLDLPLAVHWVFKPRHEPQPAWPPPKPVPIEGILELPRAHFDETYHVAVVGDALYFGSSAENKVYALNASNGSIRWTRRVGGPVRLAPAVWNHRLYVGCDDGIAYCLRTADGREVWRFQAAPHPDKVLGHGKMISLWPMRTGVLVDNGVAYFGAGIFPMEGVYMYAVRAEDGALLWKNDVGGEAVQSNVSPQGYLLASETTLFAPMARCSPAAFDRKDGRLIYTSYFGKTIGGSYAVLADEYVFTGTLETIAFNQANRGRFAWYPGRQIVVSKDVSYTLDGTRLTAVERKNYPAISLKRNTLIIRREKLDNDLTVARKKANKSKQQIQDYEEKLEWIEGQVNDLLKQGKASEAAALTAEQDRIARSLETEKKSLAAAEKQIQTIIAQKEALKKELAETDAAMKPSILWQSPCDNSDALILAGGVLFVGGRDEVAAFDAADGKLLWNHEVDGRACGLAAAVGRLFVSTDKGLIYCFGPEGPPEPITHTEQTATDPYPRDALTPLYEAAAEHIVRSTGIERGYALVLGAGKGRLAYELAKRTDLILCAVEPDPAQAEAIRQAADAAGLYGDRISVFQCDPASTPLPDYFADLIVSDRALVSGEMPGNAAEAYRLLKPCGGVLCIGQPVEASGKAPPLASEALKNWVAGTPMRSAQVRQDHGTWLTWKRGPLEGAGSWTHQYRDPANTTCSDDQLVKCPLGVLWFGEPGPAPFPSRHVRVTSPLAMDGRFFVQGENVIMAYDSYNGLLLWKRDIPEVARTQVSINCSNLALSKDSLFVVVKDQCFRLDVTTGEIMQTYIMPKTPPPAPPATPAPSRPAKPVTPIWGYVACVGNTLYGARCLKPSVADLLFALDIKSGSVRWSYLGKEIPASSISIGDGRLFFVDKDVTEKERLAALEEDIAAVKRLSGLDRAIAEKQLKAADVRSVIALDVATGKKVWRRPLNLLGCGGGAYWQTLSSIYKDDVLALFGVFTDGHFWKDFFANEFDSRRIIALSGKTGETLWAKNIGYRVRPLVVGDTLHAEPWAYDLKTGEQRTRINPITGQKEPWQFARPGHHCGCPAASPNALFFRSWSLGYYDLVGDYGTEHFGGQRPGCWINFIPANGLLIFPEASTGCMCAFPNQCTVVFKHRRLSRTWAQYSAAGPIKPVKHLAINLGGPGDRRDETGTLWLGFPRPGGSLVLTFTLDLKGLPAAPGFVRRNAEHLPPSYGELPREAAAPTWVFASGHQGLSRCVVPLLSPEDGEAFYTVRLAFAEWEHDAPGRRVFDIKLQGKTVYKNFDVVAETGAKDRGVVKEFNQVAVAENLTIDLAPKVGKPTPSKMPFLCGIEVVRERVLGLGCVLPQFLLSNAHPRQSGEARLANNTEQDFVGRVEVISPDGFDVTAQPSQVSLATGERTTLALTASLKQEMPRGKYPVLLRLLRADGGLECERKTEIEHMADRERLSVTVAEDAYVTKNAPETNYGATTTLGVDGGNARMGDEHHSVAYLKFRIPLPKGSKVCPQATLRLFNVGNPGDAARICLVTEIWDEETITYSNRPRLSKELGRSKPSAENEPLDIPLNLDVSTLRPSKGGQVEVSLAVDPLGCDGVTYGSREGKKPAELILEYEPERK